MIFNHRPLSRLALGLTLAMSLLPSRFVQAGLPEPDTIFYGSIALDGRQVTTADSNVVVELRFEAEGPVIASYRMGDNPAAAQRYLLRVRLEHAAPVLQPGAAALGSTVVLTVRDATGVRDQSTQTLTNRGQFVQLNFGGVDGDGDGMSDGFETKYFGNATSANPGADPDADGRPNLREFLQKTDPTVADGRHPADLAPADDALTITEVTDYTFAWRTGTPWSIEPTNIPIAYVTRANMLWQRGEAYVFDNTPPTNAPIWWVNPIAPPASAGSSPASTRSLALSTVEPAAATQWPRNTAVSELPETYVAAVPFVVNNSVRPDESVRVYAVEDQVPQDWVVHDVTEGGRFDQVNRKVKWGPFHDHTPREFSYQVIPAGSIVDRVEFVGTASFDGTDVPIAGQRVTRSGAEAAIWLTLRSEPGQQVKLVLRGEPGRVYVIEASTDLVHWLTFEPISADSSGTIEASDEISGTARFYRARPQANSAE